jgi:hypothetical protein
MAQDTPNLKKKIEFDYPKLIKEAEAKGDIPKAEYWRSQLIWTMQRVESRKENQKKNEKQYKKKHGYAHKSTISNRRRKKTGSDSTR